MAKVSCVTRSNKGGAVCRREKGRGCDTAKQNPHQTITSAEGLAGERGKIGWRERKFGLARDGLDSRGRMAGKEKLEDHRGGGAGKTFPMISASLVSFGQIDGMKIAE